MIRSQSKTSQVFSFNSLLNTCVILYTEFVTVDFASKVIPVENLLVIRYSCTSTHKIIVLFQTLLIYIPYIYFSTIHYCTYFRLIIYYLNVFSLNLANIPKIIFYMQHNYIYIVSLNCHISNHIFTIYMQLREKIVINRHLNQNMLLSFLHILCICKSKFHMLIWHLHRMILAFTYFLLYFFSKDGLLILLMAYVDCTFPFLLLISGKIVVSIGSFLYESLLYKSKNRQS